MCLKIPLGYQEIGRICSEIDKFTPPPPTAGAAFQDLFFSQLTGITDYIQYHDFHCFCSSTLDRIPLLEIVELEGFCFFQRCRNVTNLKRNSDSMPLLAVCCLAVSRLLGFPFNSMSEQSCVCKVWLPYLCVHISRHDRGPWPVSWR